MPFKSQAQRGKCYALKARGQGKGWDCKKWELLSKGKRLPRKLGGR